MRKLTERINVLVTAREKSRITKAARAAGISTGKYMRRAVEETCCVAAAEEAMFDAMLHLLDESTRQAAAAVDGAIAWIGASNRRIAELERAAARDDR